MFESDWLEYVPGKLLEKSIEFLNSLSWNIQVEVEEKHHKAFAGDQLLVKTNTKQEFIAFFLGMTIALAVLPDSILEDIKNISAE